MWRGGNGWALTVRACPLLRVGQESAIAEVRGTFFNGRFVAGSVTCNFERV